MSDQSALTEKQKRFCEEYIIDHNATAAAARAQYSADTATQAGSRLLTKAKVQEYIQELKSKQILRLEKTADDVLSALWSISEDLENPASARVSALGKIGEHMGMFGSKNGVHVHTAAAEVRFDPPRTIVDPPPRDSHGNLIQ